LIDHVLGVASDNALGKTLYKRIGTKGGGADYKNMTDCVLNIASYTTD